MENYASNLQEKIQKLIDQYTNIKKKYDEAVEEINLLTEQNVQLIDQVEDQTKQGQSSAEKLAGLEAELENLKQENRELKQNLQSFESIANEALSKLDVIFPDIEEA